MAKRAVKVYEIVIDPEGDLREYFTNKGAATWAWACLREDGVEPLEFNTHEVTEVLEERDQEIRELRELISLFQTRYISLFMHYADDEPVAFGFDTLDDWAHDPYGAYREWVKNVRPKLTEEGDA